MTMPTRSLAEIREDLIAALSVADPDADTSEGGDLWKLANAEAYIAAELQVRDLELSRSTLPSTATGDDLDQHAIIWLGTDNARHDATQWFGTVTLYRNDLVVTPVVAIGTALTANDGTQYETTEAVAAVDWTIISITVDAKSTDTHVGTVANKANNSTLVVTTPPADLSSSALLATTTTAALDTETDDALRARILEVTAGRPGAGNASDYVTWATSVAGVSAAFCYPRWDGIGTVTVVPLKSTGNHVITAGATLTAVQTALDAARPCGCVVTAEAATPSPLTVTPTVRVATGYAAGWTGTFTTAVTTHALTRVYVTANPTTTIEAGDWIVVPIGANDFSCARKVTSTATGATHYINVDEAFVDEDGNETAPAAAGGKTVRPGTSNYNAIIAAIKGVFDGVGPSASTDVTKPRYPAVETSACPHVYLSDLTAAIDNVEGVVSVDLTAPVANTTNAVAPGAAILLKTFVPAVVVTWGTFP